MVEYNEDIKKMNLWEKISQISSEIEYLKKDDIVGSGQNSYKAISIEKVMETVGKKMCKFGVVIYPIKQEYQRIDEVTKGIDYKTKAVVDKVSRISEVNVVYEVVNIHNPIEKIQTVSSGTGVDTQDKGVGKAMTYAYKNMIIKLFAIATGDDTDKVHSDDYTKALVGETTTPITGISDGQYRRLMAIANTKKISPNQVAATTKKDYNKVDPMALTKKEYDEIIKKLEKL